MLGRDVIWGRAGVGIPSPRKSVKMLPPPLEKNEMTSLMLGYLIGWDGRERLSGFFHFYILLHDEIVSVAGLVL